MSPDAGSDWNSASAGFAAAKNCVLSGCRAADTMMADWFWLICDAHTLLPGVFGLLCVNGPLAGSENGSSKRLSWTIAHALRIARRKNWPDVVDRDVEQTSRNDTRYRQ